jgi:peptidoglycan/xylan/chitin deacetylase (PgdA/CDA1 family)
MSDAHDQDRAMRVARRNDQRRRRLRRRGLVLAAVAVVVAAVGVAGIIRTSRSGQVATTPPILARPRPRRTTIHPRPVVRASRVKPAPLVATGASRAAAVPILMYHVIAPPPANAPYPGLYITPHDFAAQIDQLVRSGFHAVTLDQVRAAWLGTAGLPSKPIVVTFDNGYRSQYAEALPILSRVGWLADENLQLTGLPPKQGGLSRRQVRALVAAGWELDTQGYDHADLTELDAAQLRFQIGQTRTRLRRLYGAPVAWFCYPSGRYNASVIAAVRAAGFVGATTVAVGWARPGDDPFALPRLRVLAGTTPAKLLTLIADARNAPPPPT